MSVSYRFPGDRALALTFSYDDASAHDRKLADILTKHGMKGTFNVNVPTPGDPGRIQPEEYKSLYIDNGHEVACHGVTHPFFEKLPMEDFVNEVRDNRLVIEDHIQMPVKGMAYPCGTYSEKVKTVMNSLGIVYARTTKSTGRMHEFPSDWMEWHPTAHHNGNICELGKTLLAPYWADTVRMLYVWGHSFEFNGQNNWNVMEDFCSMFDGCNEVWRATNLEIYEYIKAFDALMFSADCSIVRNPSFCTVWVRKNGKTTAVPGGQTVHLE